jgi:magnesium-transporting ATPase (P-type)
VTGNNRCIYFSVNDAPAVKRADIGIAMGLAGSDVTKNASKIILTDGKLHVFLILDNFVTILRAVKEGRGIFANIQKFAVHLLSGNVSEVITLIVGLALRDKHDQAVLPMVFFSAFIIVLNSNSMVKHDYFVSNSSFSRI